MHTTGRWWALFPRTRRCTAESGGVSPRRFCTGRWFLAEVLFRQKRRGAVPPKPWINAACDYTVLAKWGGRCVELRGVLEGVWVKVRKTSGIVAVTRKRLSHLMVVLHRWGC